MIVEPGPAAVLPPAEQRGYPPEIRRGLTRTVTDLVPTAAIHPVAPLTRISVRPLTGLKTGSQPAPVTTSRCPRRRSRSYVKTASGKPSVLDLLTAPAPLERCSRVAAPDREALVTALQEAVRGAPSDTAASDDSQTADRIAALDQQRNELRGRLRDINDQRRLLERQQKEETGYATAVVRGGACPGCRLQAARPRPAAPSRRGSEQRRRLLPHAARPSTNQTQRSPISTAPWRTCAGTWTRWARSSPEEDSRTTAADRSR